MVQYRAVIMMTLCHQCVESNLDVKYALSKGISPADLRIDPIGTDVDNNSYFFFSQFTVTDFILYREVYSLTPVAP